MKLVIDDAERDMLIRILDTTVGEVRSQVRRTHSPEWHDGLKRDEAMLKSILDRLRHAEETREAS